MAEQNSVDAQGKGPPNRDIQIYTAGTVTLPPEYPAVGILSLTKTRQGDPVVQVEHAVSAAQLNRYLVLREDVSAIRIAKDGKLDPKTDTWLFGRVARGELKEESADENVYGIVYVRENVGVVWQLERAVSAGELHGAACPCEDRDGCEG